MSDITEKTAPDLFRESTRTRHKRHSRRHQLNVRIRPIHGVTPRRVMARHRHLYFPAIVGDEFATTEDASHTDITTVGGGEYSVPSAGKHSRMMESFDITALTLTWNAHFLSYHDVDPDRVRTILRRILRSRQPVHLTAIVPGENRAEYDGPVTLRSRTLRLTHGERDTRYYDLSFREYRFFNVKRRRHGNPPLPAKRRLRPDDTMRSLAFRYYGNGGDWREIAVANGIERWGSEDALVGMSRYNEGAIVLIPEKPDRDPTGLLAAEFPATGVEDDDIVVGEDV